MKVIVYAFELVVLIILMASTSMIRSQQLYRIPGEQEFKVEGTSTLHDCEMISEQVTVPTKINLENNVLKDISLISMSQPVNALKSGKRGMDDNATDSNGVAEGGPRDGRYNARFTKLTALQINPFINFKGLEFFVIYELANGSNEFTQPQPDTEKGFTQLSAELLYRFGANERIFIGGSYMREITTENLDISRLNLGGDWFISKNVLPKLEYMKQNYNGNAWTGRFAGAQFNGVMLEAGISY